MSDLLANLRSARSEEEREWLVMKFSLESLEPAILEAVWAAAIPQWFEKEFLAALLGRSVDEVGRVFEKLVSLSFVEVFQGRGYNIHERSRKLLLKRLWEENPGRYRELNKRAAEYCARQDAADAQWRSAALYHLLLAGDDLGVDEFISQGIDWVNKFQHSNLEVLVRPVLVEFEAKRVNPQAAAWAYFFQARSDTIYSRYKSAKKSLELSLTTYSQDLRLKAEIFSELGNAHYVLNEYDDAKEQFEKALKLHRQHHDPVGEANCIRSIGNIHRFLDEPKTAREKYEEALKLYRQAGQKLGEANCIYSLGEVQADLGEYSEARQRFDEALHLFRQIGNKLGEATCINFLGEISRMFAEYDEARQNHEEALELFRQINNKLGEANSIAALGELHQALGEYQEARARSEEALEMYRQMGEKIGEMNCLKVLNDIRNESGKENPSPDLG